MADILHKRVRNEFKEWCVSWGVLRTISQAFQVEGFESGPPVDGDGERRSCFDEYANVIDWADPEQVHRALRVFEEMLSWFSTTSWGAEWDEATSRLARVLRRDGFELNEDGTITSLVAAPPSMCQRRRWEQCSMLAVSEFGRDLAGDCRWQTGHSRPIG